MAPKKRSVEERIKDKIGRPDERGCMNWLGYKDSNGYATVMVSDRPQPQVRTRVSRVVWAAAHGPIPAGMLVCHRCDNPGCVNIEHLFLGTHKDNSQDMVRKGRAAHGTRKRNTKLTPENVARILIFRMCGAGNKEIAGIIGGIKPQDVSDVALGHSWSWYTGIAGRAKSA